MQYFNFYSKRLLVLEKHFTLHEVIARIRVLQDKLGVLEDVSYLIQFKHPRYELILYRTLQVIWLMMLFVYVAKQRCVLRWTFMWLLIGS